MILADGDLLEFYEKTSRVLFKNSLGNGKPKGRAQTFFESCFVGFKY